MNNRRILFLKLFVSSLIAFFISLQSCVKDSFEFDKMANPEINSEWALPLVYSSLSLNDILEKIDSNDFVKIDDENFISIYYKASLLSLSASDVASLPNQNFPYDIGMSAGDKAAFSLLPNGSTFKFSSYDSIIFLPSGIAYIDSLTFSAGKIKINFTSTIAHNGEMKITFPKTKRNGNPLVITMPMNYNSSTGQATGGKTADISNYNFNTSSPVKNTKMDVDFEVDIIKGGPDTDGEITFEISFEDLQFQKMFGYLGKQSLTTAKDTFEISIFNSITGDTKFSIADLKIKMDIKNSYGLPIGATIEELTGYSPGKTPVAAFDQPFPITINSPSLNEIGQFAQSTIEVDNTNSNIVGVINSTPQYLIYSFQTTTNPDGDVGANFVLDTSAIVIDSEFELPLYGAASGLTVQDTMDFSITELPEMIESALFRMTITNGFPLAAGIQVYFADSLYNVLDSLISPYEEIMPSAIVDPTSGKVSSATKKITDITINQTKLKKINNTKKLLINASLATYNMGNTNVKIYSDYKLDVRLGVKVKLN